MPDLVSCGVISRDNPFNRGLSLPHAFLVVRNQQDMLLIVIVWLWG
jgi:hypothetical protein